MKSIDRMLAAWTAVLVFSLGAATHAAEGRTPIWEPTVITASGKYIVTRNIIAAGGHIIEIQANGVDVDVNGMVLDGGNSPDPVIFGSGFSDLVVRNGTIVGGAPAVFLEQGKNMVVEDLQILRGEAPGGGIVLRESTNIAVRRNQVRDRDGVGIHADPGAVFTSVSGVIEDNQVHECRDGIDVDQASSLKILNNEVLTTLAGAGIRVAASRGVIVSENTVHETQAQGILLEESVGCKLYNNVVRRAIQGPGIDLPGSDNNFLLDNVVTACEGDGMTIGGRQNHIERNTLNRNGLSGSGWGLQFLTGGNVYRGNMARGNPGPAAACGGAPATTDICDQPTASTSHGDNYMPFAL